MCFMHNFDSTFFIEGLRQINQLKILLKRKIISPGMGIDKSRIYRCTYFQTINDERNRFKNKYP